MDTISAHALLMNDYNRELEEECDSLESVVPPSDIIAFNELRSCADIYRMYESGQLDINPDFQRGVVWTPKAKTLFIDSLIKQLPIPSMCISWDFSANKRIVVDGLQRISTIIEFLKQDSTWKLSNIDDVDERIAGKTVEYIRNNENRLFSLVENLTIPITVLRCDYNKKTHMQYLFQIFNRLNTGGSKLYNQEIRNCIYSGPFNTMLKELVRTDIWCSYVNTDLAKIEKSRYSNEELLLRFFALNECQQKYTGKLASFLNSFIEDHKNIREEDLSGYREIAIRILNVARKAGISVEYRNVADAILVGMAKNIDCLEKESKEHVKALIEQILATNAFSPEALKSDASGKDKVNHRLQIAITTLSSDK